MLYNEGSGDVAKAQQKYKRELPRVWTVDQDDKGERGHKWYGDRKHSYPGTLGDEDAVHKLMKSKFPKLGGNQIPCGFIVQHYACEVLYDIRGWCSKDIDTLKQTAYDCLQTSTLRFMHDCFSKEVH